MSRRHASNVRTERRSVAGTVRRFAVPIILGWVAITLLVSIGVPSLEQVAKEHAVSLSAKDAPSVQAAARMGQVFHEYDSDSAAMIVLDGQQPLGEAAHKYYDEIIRQLSADTKHVQHIQDFWSNPLTAGSAQSPDGKAAYVQVYLVGNQGEATANASVESVRHIIDRIPAPPGVKTYVTGPAALVADMNRAGDRTVVKIMLATVLVIFIMLMFVYRSVTTVLIVLAMVGIELAASRGIVAFLAENGIIHLSTFAISILVALAMAAGTDYGIFFIGRYHEARQAGEDPQTAYYTAYRGVAHVVLASGLTIAGATFCLSFTRLPIFQTLGAPCAVGMLVAVAVALTMIPAVLAVSGRFGLLDPKRTIKVRGWRRIGTAVVRWPGPILVATCAVTLVGLLALPGYKVSYKDRQYIPKDLSANVGMDVAEQHFSQARMMPEILMIEGDHDMRNSADMLILDKLAKAIFKVEGIARVQGVTRPDGTPLAHTSVPFLLSMQTAGQVQNLKFAKNRLDDMLKLSDELGGTIAATQRMDSLMHQLAGNSHHMAGVTNETTVIAEDMRQHIAKVNETMKPLIGLYSDPNCQNSPLCSTWKSMSTSMDDAERLTDKLDVLGKDLDSTDATMPQLLALLPPQIATMKSVRTMVLSMHSTMAGMFDQVDQMSNDATAMGQDFDAAKSDDSFYLPREVFANPDFQRVETLFLSPDGKAARFIITHKDDPQTNAGMASIDAIRAAAYEALKGTPLEDSRVYIAGTAAVFKDLRQAANYDFLIAGIASLCMIFIIMLIITRSLVAALVIVGTVALSLGSSFGLSVLLWQYILGIRLHWLVMVMSVIIMLAVGSDYNLLLVARFKQEVAAGVKTGIIRAMGGTGKVVTAAGLVFAFTMAAMVVSDLRMVGQVGTTVGLGLLFDTLIVRSFLTPSIAALLGRWFWWPLNVRSRPRRTRLDTGHDGHDADPEPESADLERAVAAMNGQGEPVANGSSVTNGHAPGTNGYGRERAVRR